MLRILYKNNDETEYNQKFKSGRIHPKHITPLDLTDTWNGITIKVQTTYWDGYYCEYFVGNDELNDSMLIQVADEVIITDLEQNIEITADKTTPEDFIYNEPVRVGTGNSWLISLTFKDNKRLSNKGVSTNQTNNIECIYNDGVSPETKTFYTDFDVLDSVLDTEQAPSNNNDGVNILDSALTRRTKRAVFYLAISDANNLKDFFEKSQTITINGTSVIENGIASSEDYGEGLKKVLIEGVISSIRIYPSAV